MLRVQYSMLFIFANANYNHINMYLNIYTHKCRTTFVQYHVGPWLYCDLKSKSMFEKLFLQMPRLRVELNPVAQWQSLKCGLRKVLLQPLIKAKISQRDSSPIIHPHSLLTPSHSCRCCVEGHIPIRLTHREYRWSEESATGAQQ